MTVTVEVVGTGLIGTSVGLAASGAGARVLLRDADPGHLALAAARGAGMPATTQADEPDVVVVAVPPSAVADVVVEALGRYPNATVTDVCSVKAPVVAAVAAAGVPMGRYVPGHPMAGRETSGPEAASADLFRGRAWLISPDSQSEPEHVAKVVALAESLGAAPQFVPSPEHDRIVALTSHAPQVISTLMGVRLAESSAADVAVVGQGLRDVVRLAASDASLWREILTSNAVELLPVLSGLAEDLQEVLDEVRIAAENDASASGSPVGEEIERLLRLGNAGVSRLPAKHGGAASDYTEVEVEVPDTPGSLGALFLAAGEAGINLEDVRIEHTVGRLTAIAHLYVLPESAELLRNALSDGGWPVLQA